MPDSAQCCPLAAQVSIWIRTTNHRPDHLWSCTPLRGRTSHAHRSPPAVDSPARGCYAAGGAAANRFVSPRSRWFAHERSARRGESKMEMSGQRVTRRQWVGGTAALFGGTMVAGCGPLQAGGGQPANKAHAPVTIQVYENPTFPWRQDVGKAITDPLLAANPWLTLDTSVPAGAVRDK